MHDVWDELLVDLSGRSRVDRELIGEVLARLRAHAPAAVIQAELSRGNPAARQRANYATISAATVSKVTKALRELEFVERSPIATDAERIAYPLRLSSSRLLAGVAVHIEGGVPVGLRCVLTDLSGVEAATSAFADCDTADWDDAIKQIADLLEAQLKAVAARRRRQKLPEAALLGVGVSVGAQVHDGFVVSARTPGRAPAPPISLRDCIEQELAARGQPVPVTVENDVNLLAIGAINAYDPRNGDPDPDIAVACLFHDGIGGAMVVSGRVRRGAGGGAMEIGHVDVAPPEPTEPGRRAEAFRSQCWCSGRSHVEQWATVTAMESALQQSLSDACAAPKLEQEGLSKEARILGIAGHALGHALAHVLTITNPGRFVLWLPQALAGGRETPDLAGSAFIEAVERELATSYTTSATDAPLQIVSYREEDIANDLAMAAALGAWDSFIEHARRQDLCSIRPRPQEHMTQAVA